MISCIILAQNEEKNLKECLNSVKWCDEVIIIDDYSTDKTEEIAKNFNARIYKNHLNNDFANQRNFGLDKAKGDWVLFLDSDERITLALATEIQQAIVFNTQNINGFFFKRTDVLWGRKLKHGETGNVKLLRLAKRNVGVWQRAVHEVWEIKGRKKTLKNPIIHYPHQTLREFISDIDKYSTIHARENAKTGKNSSLAKIILWPRLKFLSNYFLKKGFLDGEQGFMVAMLMSLHSFLSWSKLWLAQKKG